MKSKLQALQNYCKWWEFGTISSQSEFSLKTQSQNDLSLSFLLPFYRAVSTEEVSFKVCNLFLSKCIQDQYLIQLLRNADSVSTWVAAEIVTCHTSKVCRCFVVLLWNIYMLMCIHIYQCIMYDSLCRESARTLLKCAYESAVNNFICFH